MSPIHTLVQPWFGTPPPKAHAISQHRAALYQAACDEIRLKAEADLIYDPADDRRFLWACQWLDVANGTRYRIDLALHDCAAMFFGTPQHTHRHAAAADPSPATAPLT